MRYTLLPALTAILLVAIGCETTGGSARHEMVEHDMVEPVGHEMQCQLCYDEVRQVLAAHPKGRPWRRSVVVREHQCPECEAGMAIYTDAEGTPMVRCAVCAPEGVPCDLCRPPAG